MQQSPRPALLKTEQIELPTETGLIVVALRRDRRARNYTLRLRGALAVPTLTMPFYGSLREARSFLERHSGWLRRQIAKAPAPSLLAEGSEVPYKGVPHRIRRSGASRGMVTVTNGPDGPELIVAGGEAHLRRRLFDFFKREAKRELETAILRHAERLGVRPTSIRIRDTFTRWGSCAASGELSFSFRLIMAPPFVLDYLAAHEVAHLREMNHSRRFWRVVEGLCPDYERARAWLGAHGAGLHAIGADGGTKT